MAAQGWRSWNCYGGDVNQTKMTATMDRMAARTRAVGGKPTSLLDLGYDNVGPDQARGDIKAFPQGHFLPL